MPEERMSAKQYAKFEKVFFLYGSITKLVEPVRPNEWQAIAEEMWSWAIVKVSALVDEYTDGFLEPPPDLPAASPPVEPPSNGTDPHLKTQTILVKSIQVLKTGQTNGRNWTISKIVGMDNVGYTTFAGSRYTVGQQYTIEYEEIQNGEYIDFRIKEPKS